MGRPQGAYPLLWSSSEQVATFLRLMAAQRDAEAKRIGALIAQLRLSRGWTQEDLAHEIDVSVGTVSRWERGRTKGEPPNVRRLAKALEVEPAVLRPTAPDLETQLDRIEDKLDRVLEALGLDPGVTPEEEVDQWIAENDRPAPDDAVDPPDEESGRDAGDGPSKPS